MQFQQVAGFAYAVDAVLGEQYTPQIGFDPWFDEGLAVYYETTLQPGVGRLAWPFWHGAFAAGVAGRRIQGGELSEFNRDAFMGNHYLVGSHFVRYLAQRYGEWPLWQTIAVQARSVFFPLWINLRFWQAYDKTLETLFAEFADDVARHHPAVARPPEQRMLEKVGARGPLRARRRRQRGADRAGARHATAHRRAGTRRAGARRSRPHRRGAAAHAGGGGRRQRGAAQLHRRRAVRLLHLARRRASPSRGAGSCASRSRPAS